MVLTALTINSVLWSFICRWFGLLHKIALVSSGKLVSIISKHSNHPRTRKILLNGSCYKPRGIFVLVWPAEKKISNQWRNARIFLAKMVQLMRRKIANYFQIVINQYRVINDLNGKKCIEFLIPMQRFAFNNGFKIIMTTTKRIWLKKMSL